MSVPFNFVEVFLPFASSLLENELSSTEEISKFAIKYFKQKIKERDEKLELNDNKSLGEDTSSNGGYKTTRDSKLIDGTSTELESQNISDINQGLENVMSHMVDFCSILPEYVDIMKDFLDHFTPPKEKICPSNDIQSDINSEQESSLRKVDDIKENGRMQSESLKTEMSTESFEIKQNRISKHVTHDEEDFIKDPEKEEKRYKTNQECSYNVNHKKCEISGIEGTKENKSQNIKYSEKFNGCNLKEHLDSPDDTIKQQPKIQIQKINQMKKNTDKFANTINVDESIEKLIRHIVASSEPKLCPCGCIAARMFSQDYDKIHHHCCRWTNHHIPKHGRSWLRMLLVESLIRNHEMDFNRSDSIESNWEFENVRMATS